MSSLELGKAARRQLCLVLNCDLEKTVIMGLDAFVFCDCYEKGRIKRIPPDLGSLYVQANGDLEPRSRDVEVLDRFDAWRVHACRHEQGIIAGDQLGSAGFIDWLREAFWPNRRLFPVLLGKVIYCGTHCGDHLSRRDVAKLAVELDRLKSFSIADKSLDKHLQRLRRKLKKLVRVALRIKKPIAF